MKKRITLAFATVLALVCLFATSAFAMGTNVINTNAAVNLRTGPGTQYDRITTIPANTPVEVITPDGGSGWTCVAYDAVEGYVSTQYLGTNLHPVTNSGYHNGNANYAQYAVSAAVNLRTGPGTGYAVLTVVPAGEEVGVADYGNGWAHAWYGNYEGYICMDYIPALTHIHTGDAKGNVYNVSAAVNLRTGSGVEYGVITVIPKGASVSVTDYAYGWAHVTYNGVSGYVYMEYIPGLGHVADASASLDGDTAWYGGYNYSNVYNEEYYAAHNADVVQALGKDPAALIKHFVNYGIYEGRQAKEDFNVNTYRSQHPELDKRFGDDLHYYYLYACGIIA